MEEKSLKKIIQEIVPFNNFSLIESEYPFEFLDKCFLFVVLMAIAVAENNVNDDQEEYSYRRIKTPLDKHRKIGSYDLDIQKLLFSLGNIVTYNCTEEECSNNGYYRTKMKCSVRSIVYFVFHSYSKEAKYLQKYFRMNNIINDPKFIFLQYNFDEENKIINKITFNIPNIDGDMKTKIDLTKEYNLIKSHIFRIENRENYLQHINDLISKAVTNYLIEKKEKK